MTRINTNLVASRHINYKKGRRLVSGCCPSLKNARATLYVATKTSRIPHNLNFLGETAFFEGIFCLEYPSRRSEKVNFHFANYRFPFRKLQIFIWQTTDFHFANYRFPFRKLQISISQTTDFHFTNYRFSFRKLQISISQTTDFHFANYRFSFCKLQISISQTTDFHFVSQTTASHFFAH